MLNKDAKQLLKNYIRGNATEEEKNLLYNWYLKYKTSESDLTEEDINFEYHLGLTQLHEYIDQGKKTKRLWSRLAAAASITIALGFGLYYYNDSKSTPKTVQEHVLVNDVAPGKDKAFLTLYDGRKILLDNNGRKDLPKQPGLGLLESKQGQLNYYASNSSVTTKLINRVETPNSGQYRIKLSDGSLVWLNAASSLKFPVVFANQGNRVVELTGEAYFEVAKNKQQPFIVKTSMQKLKVLGTHFNINAYYDEAGTKTTLLEGAVMINDQTLKPGQQSILVGNKLKLSMADLETAIAWKENLFHFNDENIVQIMKKIGRWYDVDVEYRCKTDDKIFNGDISRFKNLSEVLATLELTKSIHFKIEGRRVIVMN